MVPLVEVSGVAHGWGTTLALSGVDLQVAAEELICIVGPSGCGKSTLVSLLAGLAQPTTGAVSFRGHPITTPSHERAVVFQDGALFPWLTVEGNVTYPMAIRGVARFERQARAADLLRRVHLFSAKDKYPHELSGGMHQRVAIARALAADPELLIMDEPFSALDSETRARLHDELLRLWRAERKTIVFVTHDAVEAVRLADRILVLSARPGRVEIGRAHV